ncbi:hypothetical protein ANN_03669 [Periplaneta americana]|uniref:DUF4817 domain-containing protein n=1 Tax=Periplaneta americana TaxID=6978 RepID=A0ABQ8U1H0_PERAM|nr:hypothetical protein ANN_03669 [Periplaneta americana]
MVRMSASDSRMSPRPSDEHEQSLHNGRHTMSKACLYGRSRVQPWKTTRQVEPREDEVMTDETILLEEGKKKFEKQTAKFCMSQERYLNLSTKKQDAVLKETLFDQTSQHHTFYDRRCISIQKSRRSRGSSCIADGGSNRRIYIIAINRNKHTAEIIDPTIRFEISATRPSEVNEEKMKIYEPTIQYLSAKYNIEKSQLPVSSSEREAPFRKPSPRTKSEQNQNLSLCLKVTPREEPVQLAPPDYRADSNELTQNKPDSRSVIDPRKDLISHVRSFVILTNYSSAVATTRYVEEKAFCVLQLAKLESIIEVQLAFRRQFNKQPPHHKQIYQWHRKFVEDGCICKQKSTGRPRTSNENVERKRDVHLMKATTITNRSKERSMIVPSMLLPSTSKLLEKGVR